MKLNRDLVLPSMSVWIRKYACLLSIILIGGAHLTDAKGALVINGDGTVLDTATNLLWLQDWSTMNGPNDWSTTNSWALGLSFAGRDNWVLPTRSDFTTLFGDAGSFSNLNAAFSNIQSTTFYWTSEEQNPGTRAYIYKPSLNLVSDDPEWGSSYGVAVATAPEPSKATMLLAGLLAIGIRSTRKRKGV